MGVILLACALSFVALCSGILAIGSGRHWQFKFSDIRKGKKNAVLYCWVTGSSIFSMAHTAACVQYALVPHWGTGTGIQIWFAIHACIGLLLTSAHIYITKVMSVQGADEVYLWEARA